MADEKNNKVKEDPDSKKTGNSCGFYIGLLVIIITVAAVIFFLFLKPALEDAGYSYDDLKEKYKGIKDKTGEQLDDLKDLDVKSREELDKTSPKLIAD